MSDQINRADIMALPKLSLTLGKMGRIELHHEKPLKGVSQWINVKDIDGLRYADQPALADAQIARLVEALNHAQYGLSWAVRYFKDQDVTKDDPCPPCSRGLSATRAALAAVKGGDA